MVQEFERLSGPGSHVAQGPREGLPRSLRVQTRAVQKTLMRSKRSYEQLATSNFSNLARTREAGAPFWSLWGHGRTWKDMEGHLASGEGARAGAGGGAVPAG